ncbi:MAG TPA: hypothetical protein PKE69_10300 [Pyrinomonadaceae bacterium]|nr:hypothetical protein [Pyrinomonadaceae bacterium]
MRHFRKNRLKKNEWENYITAFDCEHLDFPAQNLADESVAAVE